MNLYFPFLNSPWPAFYCMVGDRDLQEDSVPSLQFVTRSLSQGQEVLNVCNFIWISKGRQHCSECCGMGQPEDGMKNEDENTRL